MIYNFYCKCKTVPSLILVIYQLLLTEVYVNNTSPGTRVERAVSVMSFWLNKMTQIGRKLVIRQRTANNNTYIGANQMETNWLSTIEVVSGACSLQQQACFNLGDDVIISKTLFYMSTLREE